MAKPLLERPELDALDEYKYGWRDSDSAGEVAERGLSEAVVRKISSIKNEPEWMLKNRLKGLQMFARKPMPTWGADLSELNFDEIKYFVQSADVAGSWEDLPEDIRKTYDRLGIPEAERQRLVAGVTAQYECLAEGSLVWTTEGFVPIETISPGAKVFALDEESRQITVAPVVGSTESGVKEVFELQLQGRRISASANHPFLTLVDRRKPGRQRRRYNPEWTKLENLKVGDIVAVPRGLPEFGLSKPLNQMPEGKVHAPKFTNPDLLWWLGFLIGDGNLVRDKGSYKIQLAVHEVDVAVIAELNRVAAEQFGTFSTQAKDGYRITFHSKALLEWLEDLGFFGNARTKQVPKWIFKLPTAERLAFLGGWVDADGYVRPKSSGSVVLTSASKKLLLQANEIAVLSGLVPSGPWKILSKHPHDKTRTIEAYRCGFAGNFELLDCRNPRRTERFGRRAFYKSYVGINGTSIKAHVSDHLGFARITGIVSKGSQRTYDIEVAGHHNFVAEGFIVHNSTVVYHQIQEGLEAQGVIFTDTDTALQQYPEIFQEYFGTVIPAGDNKFAALNTAAWSGGSFLYVPKNVHVEIPLQAYFRINTENMGQFERTLIIAEEGAEVSYFEGCLLAGEEIALADGRVKVVEEVERGDLVRDHRGKNSKVKELLRRPYSGSIYTFKPLSTGNTFTTTGEHPLYIVPRAEVTAKRAKRGNWQAEVDGKSLLRAKPKWVKAEAVRAGDFLVFPKSIPQPVEQLPAALGKLAGYYLAEGSSSVFNGCKALAFSFHMDETEYVEEVRALTQELYGTRGSVAIDSAKHSATVTVYTAAGHDFMKMHVGDRSWRKQLSPLLFNQAPEFINNLIAGYVNGDGNLFIRNGRTAQRPATTSRAWAFQLQSLLTRFGIFATVRLERKGGPAEIMGRQVTRHDLYKIFWTESKTMGEIHDAGDYFLVPIKQVTEALYEGLVYNFETSPANSYLAKGFAVHNCSAPVYKKDSLHSAVVEIIAKKNSHVRYTTIQNWSDNVYNLVTKRAIAHEGSLVEWVDVNRGSKVTMKYPSIYLVGEHARGETLSAAFAGPGQHQDTGAKMIHMAPYTQSSIVSKSIAKGGGRAGYRGEVRVDPNAHHSANTVRCDALLVDTMSRSDTYPAIDIRVDDVQLGHEATVSKISEEQLFYLMSRGLKEDEAMAMIVRGFIEPVARELPMEYALELNKLIEMSMEGSVG